MTRQPKPGIPEYQAYVMAGPIFEGWYMLQFRHEGDHSVYKREYSTLYDLTRDLRDKFGGLFARKVERDLISTKKSSNLKPFNVRASCGHIVIRKMREATAGVTYTPDVILDAPNGRACHSCEGEVTA